MWMKLVERMNELRKQEEMSAEELEAYLEEQAAQEALTGAAEAKTQELKGHELFTNSQQPTRMRAFMLR